MAEKKQYITKAQENGSVMISEDVISGIVANAVADVKGTVSVNSKSRDSKNKKWNKWMRIAISDTGAVAIEVDIVVGFGQQVTEIAADVQKAVINAVQATAGVKRVRVHVNVCGISRQ